MKLIKGSYCYIIGMLVLWLSSVTALAAFIFTLCVRGSLPQENPFLSPYGSAVSGSIVTVVAMAVLSVCAVFCAARVFLEGLRKNSLSGSMKLVSAMLVVYAGVILADVLLNKEHCESTVEIVWHCLRLLPTLLLAVICFLLSENKLKWKLAALILCGVCAVSSFLGFGFFRIFSNPRTSLIPGATKGWTVQLLLTLAVCFFFVGLFFCICGCEKKIRKGK